jgi:hypothetical protein
MGDDGWRLEIESASIEVMLDKCFEEILPRETDRFIEKALAKDGLPEGLRRFLEAVRDDEFDGHEASEAFSVVLLAVALATRRSGGKMRTGEPDLETSLVLVGGVAGVDALWQSFVADQGNARFRDERPAAEWVVEMLHLGDLLQAGIVVLAKEVKANPPTRESLRILVESAVMRLFAKTVAD